MLEASFLLLTLGPLAAFIIWESYRHRRTSVKPLSRTSMERGFVPGAKTAERVCFIFAVAMAVFVVFLIIQPQHPPFAGRGAFSARFCTLGLEFGASLYLLGWFRVCAFSPQFLHAASVCTLHVRANPAVKRTGLRPAAYFVR